MNNNLYESVPVKIERILIFKKHGTPLADTVAERLEEWGRDRGIEMVDSLDAKTPDADLVVVLGGDGTFLAAVRFIDGLNIPVLGVNLGSLGFLTEIALEDLFPALEDVASGRARIEPRMTMICEVERKGEKLPPVTVLNDVVLNKGAIARISDLRVTVGGEYLATYRADGVIVATPTGSTAYSLSAGGSIVAPGVEALLITPVCPHAMTQRPIILPTDREISLSVERQNGDIYVTLDGQLSIELHAGDVVRVNRSPKHVLMVCSSTHNYFGVLRAKLLWGAEGRQK